MKPFLLENRNLRMHTICTRGLARPTSRRTHRPRAVLSTRAVRLRPVAMGPVTRRSAKRTMEDGGQCPVRRIVMARCDFVGVVRRHDEGRGRATVARWTCSGGRGMGRGRRGFPTVTSGRRSLVSNAPTSQRTYARRRDPRKLESELSLVREGRRPLAGEPRRAKREVRQRQRQRQRRYGTPVHGCAVQYRAASDHKPRPAAGDRAGPVQRRSALVHAPSSFRNKRHVPLGKKSPPSPNALIARPGGSNASAMDRPWPPGPSRTPRCAARNRNHAPSLPPGPRRPATPLRSGPVPPPLRTP